MALWVGFGVLGLIWGSSFLLIKIGVGVFTPLQLVALRVGLAAAAMLITLRLTKQALPADRRSRLGQIGVGLVNTAIPFFLITWGEQSIPSGLAPVRNATPPLFSLVIAHFALADERITPLKVLGRVSGFAGIVVLASRSLGVEGLGGSLSGLLAVLAASGCYAAETVFVRRTLRHLKPMVVACGALLTATGVMVPAALLVDGLPAAAGLTAGPVVAILILGLLNTYVAYLIYYWLLDRWGATRTTLVTYLMPPVGLALGAIFLSEVVDARLILGALLIVAGVALVNLRFGAKPVPAVAPTPQPEPVGEPVGEPCPEPGGK